MTEIIASLIVVAIVVLALVSIFKSISTGSKVGQFEEKYRDLKEKISEIKLALDRIDTNEILSQQTELIGQISRKINQEIETKFKAISTDCKCPKCNGFTKPGAKKCTSCGESFYKEGSKTGRVLSFVGGPGEDECLLIKWECLSCDEVNSIELNDIEVDYVKSIQPLKCKNCEVYCGEILVDGTSSLIEISKVHPKGELELS